MYPTTRLPLSPIITTSVWISWHARWYYLINLLPCRFYNDMWHSTNTCDMVSLDRSYQGLYNTIQYNCLFRAPIAKNKSYSKALYIVQCTVTTIIIIIRSKFEKDEFLVWFWMIRWMARGGWRQVDCSTRMDQQQRTLVDQMSSTCAGLRSRLWQMSGDSISIRLLCTVWPRMTCNADMTRNGCWTWGHRF